MMKYAAFLFAFSLCLSAPVDADADQYRARAALEAGEILSLAHILDAVATREDGRSVEIDVDAATGTILELEEYEHRYAGAGCRR
jgi:hypothetical protein